MTTDETLPEPGPLTGSALALCAALLGVANLMAVLDIDIANVSIPNIAGGLAVSPSQGTWIITSYGIAEAVAVPLTGWLARRFGEVRTFVVAMALFGLFSALCGVSRSFETLILLRVLQGLAGGPMIPISQTLLLGVFPKEKATAAVTIWTLGGAVGPVLGLLMGGWICDRFSWPWIFLINAPIAMACAGGVWLAMRRRAGPARPQRIDVVGLGLLVVWVGGLQIVLDRGKELDWFRSPFIVVTTLVAAIAFAVFVVWELTDDDPIVDLTVFRHRSYTAPLIVLCVVFGCYFGSVVLSPLWMQTSFGYTATQAALAVIPTGVVVILLAQSVSKLMGKVGNRTLIFLGVMLLAMVMVWRGSFASNVTFRSIMLTHAAMGVGVTFFFIPIFSTVLGGLSPAQLVSGAGLMAFLRTTSGAFAASIVTTAWDNTTVRSREGLMQSFDGSQAMDQAAAAGLPPDQALAAADAIVQGQSVMVATNHVYLFTAAILGVTAFAIWLAPKAKAGAPLVAGH